MKTYIKVLGIVTGLLLGSASAQAQSVLNPIVMLPSGSSGGGATSSIVVGTTTITGGSTGNILFDNSGVLGEKTTTGTGSVVLATNPTITNLITNQSLTNSGNISGVATTTTGSRIIQSTVTVTDTTSTGTVAADYVNRFGITTLAASSVTTYTNAYGSWFEPPTAGTNITITNKYAAGFNGNIGVAGITGLTGTQTVLLSFNSSGNATFNIGGTPYVTISSTPNTLSLISSGTLGFSVGNPNTQNMDSAFSRIAPGNIGVGTGTAGSTAGTLQLTNISLLSTGNTFTRAKATDPVTAPGAGSCKTYWVAGTVGSSGKLIAYCGTSTTPVSIVDNVGSGF